MFNNDVNLNNFNLEEELKKLPESPGVYIFKNKENQVIYIGKAVSLKKRIKQYFQSLSNHSQKTIVMISKITYFEYMITDTEFEALMLECNLIKKYKPKFNILLKDDKNYPYIKVTVNEEYPRILSSRRNMEDGAKYFGPYLNIGVVKDTISIIKKLFPLKTCKKSISNKYDNNTFISNRHKIKTNLVKTNHSQYNTKPCLNYHINKCLAPCNGNINKERYALFIKDVCDFLNGKHNDIIKKFEYNMRIASEELKFEKAAVFRDKIKSLKHIIEKQKVISISMKDQDVIAFAQLNEIYCVQVFFIREGKLIGKNHFIFRQLNCLDEQNLNNLNNLDLNYLSLNNSNTKNNATDTNELITTFVKQFYNLHSYIPEEIILQENIDDVDLIQKWLTQLRKSKVYITIPLKGEKLELIKMVEKNALFTLRQLNKNEVNIKNNLEENLNDITDDIKYLSELIKLAKAPNRIEAYDVSNTGKTEIVGSMIVVKNGIFVNNEYKRFKIKSNQKQDDYASMQEIIYRRFKYIGDFTEIPDLILIDGGLGHASCITNLLEEMKIYIPVFGMVKDKKHKTRGLISKYQEIYFADIVKKNNIKILKLITTIQNEAHRFACEYNKILREKRYRSSVLDEIKGIGFQRKKNLIKHFGSIDKIKLATFQELIAVKGINMELAQNIYNYFRK